MEAIKRIVNWLSVLITSENNKDWKVVVLCIIAATTFWFFNSLNKSGYNTSINYPIELLYDNPNDSLMVVEAAPEEIEINVSGRGWVLFRETFWFNSDPLQISIESPVDTKFLTRETIFPLITQKLSELSVESVVADTVFFTIEKIISKKVKIFVDSLHLPLDSDYQLTSNITIQPDCVLIVGPSSLIGEIPNNLELRIDEEEIDENYEQDIEANLIDNPLISYYPADVMAKFEVDQFSQKSMVIPIQQINVPPDSTYSITDSLITISYYAGRKTQDQIRPSDFVANADFSAINKSDSTIEISIESLSEFPRNVVGEPGFVKVIANE